MSDPSEDDEPNHEKDSGIMLLRMNKTGDEFSTLDSEKDAPFRPRNKISKNVSFDHSLNSSFIPIRVPPPAKMPFDRKKVCSTQPKGRYPPISRRMKCSSGNEKKNLKNGRNLGSSTLPDISSWSDSSLECDNSYTYDFKNSKLTFNKVDKKPIPNKRRENGAPYLHKTYKIGKNTNLNITMTRPVVGSLLKSRDKQKKGKEETRGDQREKKETQFGLNCIQKGKIKAIISRKREPQVGRPNISLPISHDTDRLPTEDESEESFRTFVLDTSTRPGYAMSQEKRSCHQLKKRDLYSSSTQEKMFENQDPPTKEVTSLTGALYHKMLPFKFLLNGKGSSSCSFSIDAATARRSVVSRLPDLATGQPDNKLDNQATKEDSKRTPKHETISKMKASLDSFFHFNEMSKDRQGNEGEHKTNESNRLPEPPFPESNSGDRYGTYNIHNSSVYNYANRGSQGYNVPNEVYSNQSSPVTSNQNRFTNLKKPPAKVPHVGATSNAQNRRPSPLTKTSQPKVPPRRIPRCRPPNSGLKESSTRIEHNVSPTSPKPKKGILKKSSLPLERHTNSLNKRSVGVTYALPPSPTETDEGGSQTSNLTENDSGLELDLEVQPLLKTCINSQTSFTFPNHKLWSRECLPQRESDDPTMTVLRGWKQKYEVLLGLVKEPGRLLPETLAKEVRLLESQRQELVFDRALLQSNLDSRENMGGAKGRRSNERAENLRCLYEQAAALDCMLTSLETQIEVLTSVQNNLPKEFHDTFHDSGTSGHEPDSLEAIETVVDGERVSPCHKGHGVGPGDGPGPGGGGLKEGEAAVLLQLERCAHRQTRKGLQEARQKCSELQRRIDVNSNSTQKPHSHQGRSVGSDLESLQTEHELLNSLESLTSASSSSGRFADEIKLREMTISQLRLRVLQLEKARLDKVPLDAAKEISRLNTSVIQLEKARDELTLQNFTLKSRLAEITSKIADPAATYQVNKEQSFNKESLSIGLQKLSEIDDPEVAKILRKATYKVGSESQKVREMCFELDATEEKYRQQIAHLENEMINQQNSASEKFDRHIRNLENQLEESHKKLEVTERFLLTKEEECNVTKLDFDTLNEENKRLKQELNETMMKQKEMIDLATECQNLQKELSKLRDEKRVMTEDFNRERVLRKKYYNQIEEMKGKIRVFCRLRPISEMERRNGGDDVTKIEDDFSITLETSRGPKTFLFDKVFGPQVAQENIFEDTRALIQSAFDGYNVTLMAYGQTGSGKTYTMLGTDSNPGIAPRAFERIFELAEEGRSRYEVAVNAYMLELYNDRLIDLLRPQSYTESLEKLEIKRDKRGAVHVSGANTRSVASSGELLGVFEEGLANRHTAATRMNLSSSRSHLLITVFLSVTSKQTGTVTKGKVTLVDLAGSERVQKSGVTAETLREANAINKSLSALGDVIAALSAEASFIPYRNSKLTMLLQDTIGGNAKTLVFVNVSPASFNGDESLVSLMYASRIKTITNNACKNAENKEISRLKSIIAKLKKGEDLEDESTL